MAFSKRRLANLANSGIQHVKDAFKARKSKENKPTAKIKKTAKDKHVQEEKRQPFTEVLNTGIIVSDNYSMDIEGPTQICTNTPNDDELFFPPMDMDLDSGSVSKDVEMDDVPSKDNLTYEGMLETEHILDPTNSSDGSSNPETPPHTAVERAEMARELLENVQQKAERLYQDYMTAFSMNKSAQENEIASRNGASVAKRLYESVQISFYRDAYLTAVDNGVKAARRSQETARVLAQAGDMLKTCLIEREHVEKYSRQMAAKRTYRKFPASSKEADLEANVVAALEFCARALRYTDAYRKGLNGKQAAYASKKYRGHRCLPVGVLAEAEKGVGN